MKSGVTTYVLIIAVLAVWGFVAWKIFFARPISPDVTISRSAPSEPGKTEEYGLRFDYLDPFLKDVIPMAPKHSDSTQESAPFDSFTKDFIVPPEDFPMKYAGTISAGGRISYIFEHLGLLHSLSPGKSLEGYTLTEVFTDSVRFAKDGAVFTIHIQQ